MMNKDTWLHSSLIPFSLQDFSSSLSLFLVECHSGTFYSKLDPVRSQDQFQLHLGEYTGNAGNALADVRGPRPAGQKWAGPGSGSTRVKFSTYDQLNDESEDNAKCIRHTKAGWWFSK